MPKPFPNSGYKKPVTPDSRNYILEKAQPVVPYPVTYSTDIGAIGIFDQEQIPDCVENAITKAHQYYLWKNFGTVVSLCRRFLVYWTVLLDNFPLANGTSVENGLKELLKRGICEDIYFPDNHSLDDISFSTTIPSQQAIQNGTTHTAKSYAFLSSINEQTLKNAIYQNGVVIVGLALDKNWWIALSGVISWAASDLFTNNGNLRLPTDQASLSGHAVVLSGYDLNGFFGPNSFGTTWGDNGFLRIGLDYLPYIHEAATIVDLMPAQIQQAQQANQIVNTIQQLNNVETPQNINTIQGIIAQLWAQFLSIFQ